MTTPIFTRTVPQLHKVVYAAGAHYLLTHFMAKTYSVRSMTTGDVIGMFVLDEAESRVIGVHGIDIPLVLHVAQAALDAEVMPGEQRLEYEGARSSPQISTPQRAG